MTTETIHKSALRILQLISDCTTLTYEKLRNISNLPDREINAALGWLVREETVEIIQDPVSKEEYYKLSLPWENGGY